MDTTVQEQQSPAPAIFPQGRQRGGRKKILVAVLLLAALALGGGGFALYRQLSQPPQAVYTDHTVALGTLTLTLTEPSVLEPKDRRSVGSLVTGAVLWDGVETGAQVAAGDLLYTVDAADAREQAERSRIALAQAERAQATAAQGVADLTVTAPVSGRVTAVYVKNGDLAAAGDPLVRVVDPGALSVTLPFLAGDAAALVPGQAAVLALEATGETLPGTVARVSSGTFAGPQGTVVANVVIDFSNPGAVRPGDRITASVGPLSCNQPGGAAYRAEQDIHAKVPGEVSGLTLIEGDRVAAGETVATLVSPQAHAALETARLGLEAARATLQGGLDGLRHYEIYAPISGTVVEKRVSAGDKLTTGGLERLAELADLTALLCVLDVDELDVGAVRVGQPVRVTADACPGEVFTGEVDSIGVLGSASGGVTTFPVRVALRDYGALRPGMNVSAQVVTAQVQDVPLLPIRALGADSTVLVKTPAGTYEPRSVTVGRSDGTSLEITAGLAPGDVVGIPE